MSRRSLSIVLAACVLLSRSAVAFECSPVPQCDAGDSNCVEPSPPVLTQAWNQRCVPFWIRRGDGLFSGETMEDLVERSFAVWSGVACTDMTVLFMGYTDEGQGFDGSKPDEQRNVIFSTSDPAELGTAGPDVLAITLTSFSSSTGEIFDADIVFNRLSASFAVVEIGGTCPVGENGERPFDIENTLVHEVGHFFGFDHVAEPEATMFAMAQACETAKRSLAPDDRDAMCEVYPSNGPTATCVPPSSYEIGPGDPAPLRDQCERALERGCGCSTSAPASPRAAAGPMLWALVLAWLGIKRARGREASRPCAAPRAS